MDSDYPFSPYSSPAPAEPSPQTSSSPSPNPAAALRDTVSEAVEFERQEQEVQQSACAMIVVIAVIVGLLGFGGWYYLGNFPRDKTSAPPLSSEQKDPNLIVAATGGKVVSPYGVEVIVPPGALTKDKRIEIERVAIGDITDMYRLKPEGLKFSKPVTVAIPYKESGLKTWESPENIILEYWFTAGDQKRSLGYEVDESVKKLRTRVTQF